MTWRALKSHLARWHQSWSITRWPSKNGRVDIRALFIEYQERGSLYSRLMRIVPFSLNYFALALGLFTLTGFPDRPVRGAASSWTDLLFLSLSVLFLVSLIAYVVDITRLTERFIRQLGEGKTDWPKPVIKKYETSTGLPRDLVAGIIDVDFVATHTKHVNLAVYLPFVAIALVMLSRNAYFDRWSWPFSLNVILMVYFAMAVVCGWSIRKRARRVRTEAMQDLEAHRVVRKATPVADRIDLAIKRIQEQRVGAYSGWWQDPALVGLLITPAGAGAISILRSLFAW